jgi:ABC-type polysaccharide/polyol phosphate transport system ATPase subunit
VALDTSADADATGGHGVGNRAADLTAEPVAIEVRGLDKSFRIPTQRISRLKERLINPFARQEYRRLQALRDVSFDIHQGEFFGILGRNGSGKSTLLKIMASIYRADAGTVRMAGRIAPFIELGVGFDMELSARENIVLNGVMMGLTPKEAGASVGEVLEFAELEQFADMKLKNYSSGMLVRLAFSVMIQADTDILLIDEVLAVGDAAFQQKCADVFHRMRDRGKTIVLVTHDTATVEQYCHRAMLLNDGRIVQIGDPGEVARRYLRLNFERHLDQAEAGDGAGQGTGDIRLLDVWLEDADGARITNVEQGKSIRVRALLEARRALPDPQFGFIIANADDVHVHEFLAPLADPGRTEMLVPGQRVKVSVDVDNALSPGRYYLHHGVARNRNRRDVALFAPQVLGFVVFGDEHSAGIVAAEHEMQVAAEAAEGQ